MKVIPTISVPSQTLNVTLSGQPCQLNIYTLDTGLYMNVTFNGVDIAYGVLCQNKNRIIRAPYLGFIGDFFFLDTQDNSDPVYSGLGQRFQLIYLEAFDL